MPAQHTVCYSGKQVGLRQLQLTFTENSIHRARGDCSHVGEGGAFTVDYV